MIGYVTLGTKNLKEHAKFYDAIAREMGVGRMMDEDTFIAWGEPGGPAGVAITRPFDGQEPTAGNGTMVAFEAEDADQVKRIYDIAIAQGGTDEGAPGDRGGGFYAAYFRDLDGNKLNAFCMAKEG
ncbi:VOC family protein [Altererythrobacter aquiaggeris]|uniref:VOC family protein n=1 Tax=Aestuarierythrobacter aquiaggeris TaxID=1898396 RepID=UPI0030174155